MSNYEEVKKEVHPFKETLSNLGVTPAMVARYLGMSYAYIYNQLSGTWRMSKPVQRKLTELIDRLEQAGSAKLIIVRNSGEGVASV